MNRKYGLKCFLYVIHFLKNKIQRGGVKVKFHQDRKLEYHQNKLFKENQTRLYGELNGDDNSPSEAPDATEETEFWKGIWSVTTTHKKDAKWLEEVRENLKDLENKKTLQSQ